MCVIERAFIEPGGKGCGLSSGEPPWRPSGRATSPGRWRGRRVVWWVELEGEDGSCSEENEDKKQDQEQPSTTTTTLFATHTTTPRLHTCTIHSLQNVVCYKCCMDLPPFFFDKNWPKALRGTPRAYSPEVCLGLANGPRAVRRREVSSLERANSRLLVYIVFSIFGPFLGYLTWFRCYLVFGGHVRGCEHTWRAPPAVHPASRDHAQALTPPPNTPTDLRVKMLVLKKNAR